MSLLTRSLPVIRNGIDVWRVRMPGVALSGLIAATATLIEWLTGSMTGLVFERPVIVPAMVGALLIGIGLSKTGTRPVFAAGMEFCVKRLLRVAVALMGLKIALSDLVGLGIPIAAAVLGAMAVTIISGVLIAKAVGQSESFGVLAGCATAVCGSSAALATASVLPAYRDKHADTIFVIVAANVLSTVAMLIYPHIATALSFDNLTTGILLGATIHDVAQVAGASYTVADSSGNIAIIVKLFRVFMLLPIVLLVGKLLATKTSEDRRARVPFPWFAVAFIFFVALNSTGLLPVWVTGILSEISRLGLLLAIAALGLATSMRSIVQSGRGRVTVMCSTTLIILITVTFLLYVI